MAPSTVFRWLRFSGRYEAFTRAWAAAVGSPLWPCQAARVNRASGVGVSPSVAGDALPDELRDAGRKSALRLRQTATGHEQRSAVVTALSDLGLQEEADRLEERLASAPVPATAPGAYGHGAYGHSARQVTPNGTDRIEKLLSEDRRDDALRLALREINAVGQNLATGNNYILQHGTTQTLRSLITTHGLTEDLIALADPGDDARGKRALNFGLMLEALDENDRAAAAYRKTLAVRPDPAAAARLIVLELTQGNPSQAAEALALVPQRQQPQLVLLLQNSLQQNSHDRPQFARNAALAAAQWIETADDPATLNAGWVSAIFWTLPQQQYNNNNGSFPHLYDRDAWAAIDAASEDTPHRTSENLTERLAAHDRLATALLANPAAAPDAAARLALSAELRHRPLDDLIETITTAVTVKPPRGAVG